ncbi:hypothetical protein EHQ92_01645 [Leptospira biflexa]|uniref:hypothetical protein n=1 Tax=Leptospira biflexa TaxID=172 RepID=UPI001091558F|nr:hypothetical protein [Leptospira biflexa]TGM46653.1 hypothetical protein EHQ92_01645 [Leptospira biflexa]TGM50883.1 hypothetical protein EHQ88_11440 [Leptospira biflexa]
MCKLATVVSPIFFLVAPNQVPACKIQSETLGISRMLGSNQNGSSEECDRTFDSFRFTAPAIAAEILSVGKIGA